MFMRHSALASLLVVAAKWAAAQNFPSTTTTTTSATETDTSTVTETLTTTVQLPDVTTINTIGQTTTMPTVTVSTTTTLVPVTTTLTAARPKKTVVDKNCVDYHVRFGKNCCPRSYCKPKGKQYYRRSPEEELDSFELEALHVKEWNKEHGLRKRQSVQTTPCSQSAFTDFGTASQGGTVDLLTNYNFLGATVIRVQDLYAVNVCGDVYLDGAYLGSTNCPALNGGNTSDYETDPDAAVASGNFAWGDFNIPAGVHTISFLTTYEGGQAYYRLSSQQQCELDVSTTTIATVSTTVTSDAYTTTNLPPLATDTISTTQTTTTTPAPLQTTVTMTPATAQTTFTPAPAKVKVCKQVYVDISCPRYTSNKLIGNWGHGQLQHYKSKTHGDLGIQCGAELFVF